MKRFLIHIAMYLSTVAVFAQSASGENVDSLRVKALLAEGDVYYQRFDNRLALDAYFKAYEISPTSFEVLTRLAKTTNDYGLDLKAEEREDEAKQTFENALNYAELMHQTYPDDPVPHIHLASIKKNLALMKGVRDKFEFGRDVATHCVKAMEADSMNPDLYVTYAVFHRDIASMHWVERTLTSAVFGQMPDGSPEQALAMLQKAIKLNPLLHVAHFEIAVTYINLGLHDEAVPYLLNTMKLAAQTTQDNRNRQLANRLLDRIQR